MDTDEFVMLVSIALSILLVGGVVALSMHKSHTSTQKMQELCKVNGYESVAYVGETYYCASNSKPLRLILDKVGSDDFILE